MECVEENSFCELTNYEMGEIFGGGSSETNPFEVVGGAFLITHAPIVAILGTPAAGFMTLTAGIELLCGKKIFKKK